MLPILRLLLQWCFLRHLTDQLIGLQIGAVAITVASPTDLVKVRLQSEGKLPPGVPRRYSGAMNAYSTIVRQVSCYFEIFK
jgi:hypothetical protein